MGICFSESSRQSAVEGGVDAAAAARWVKVQLDKVLCSGKPTRVGLEKMLEDAEIPRQYVQCQVKILDTMLVDIARTAGPGIALVVPAETSGQILPSAAAGRGVASVVVQGEAPEGGEFDGLVRPARERWGGGVGLALELDAAAESGAHPQQLVSTVKRATEAGIATVMFSSLGLIPQNGFDAVKQAIRYASRTLS